MNEYDVTHQDLQRSLEAMTAERDKWRDIAAQFKRALDREDRQEQMAIANENFTGAWMKHYGMRKGGAW